MKSPLDRRSFLRLASATAAFLAQKGNSQTAAPARPVPLAGRAPARGKKNFVGIQVAASHGWTRASTRCWTTFRKGRRQHRLGLHLCLWRAAPAHRRRLSRPRQTALGREHRHQRRRALRLRPEVLPEHQAQGFPSHRLWQVQCDRAGRAQSQGPRHGLLRLGPEQSQPHAGAHRAQLCRGSARST